MATPFPVHRPRLDESVLVIRSSRSPDGDHAALTASGDLDVFGADELRRALLEHAKAGGHYVSVDLRAVEFVDGSGLGHLARRWSHMPQDLGIDLVLIGAGRSFWRTARLTQRSDSFGDQRHSPEACEAAVAAQAG